MNTKFKLLLLGFILLVVIIISLSNAGPVPYHENTLFPKEYPYKEGLSSKNKEETGDKKKRRN